MKRTFQSRLLASVLLLALPVFSPAAEARSCSTAKTAGKYGFTLAGTLILPAGAVPVAAVGRATLEADENLSGTEGRSVGGGFADETFTGTLTVDPDCTGTATINFYEAGQLVRISILSIVVDDNNQEIRMVQKSLTLPSSATVRWLSLWMRGGFFMTTETDTDRCNRECK